MPNEEDKSKRLYLADLETAQRKGYILGVVHEPDNSNRPAFTDASEVSESEESTNNDEIVRGELPSLLSPVGEGKQSSRLHKKKKHKEKANDGSRPAPVEDSDLSEPEETTQELPSLLSPGEGDQSSQLHKKNKHKQRKKNIRSERNPSSASPSINLPDNGSKREEGQPGTVVIDF